MSDNLQDFDDDQLSDSEAPLDNVDDIGSRAVANTGLSSGGYQTEGGVIMPEGGANPCVIKVCILCFYTEVLYDIRCALFHLCNIAPKQISLISIQKI